MAGSGSQDYLIYDGPCLLGMFFEIVGQHFAGQLIDDAHYFIVAKFRFSLSFKLWFLNFH